MAKVITFTETIRPDARIRVWLEDEGGMLRHFAVTLEHDMGKDDWRAVVRYDTTGGAVHRDRLKPDGSYLTHRESVRLGSDWHGAVHAARSELHARAEWYIAEFRRQS